MRKQKPENPDIVWGAAGIGDVINTTESAAYHLLEGGKLPARKVGGRWAASRAALLRHFDAEALDSAKAA